MLGRDGKQTIWKLGAITPGFCPNNLNSLSEVTQYTGAMPMAPRRQHGQVIFRIFRAGRTATRYLPIQNALATHTRGGCSYGLVSETLLTRCTTYGHVRCPIGWQFANHVVLLRRVIIVGTIMDKA
jgi:hypothetical protein